MERVAIDVEGLHLGIANLDALLVGARVERTLDLQASLGRGRRDQLDDGQSVRQRSATPALRDMAEQAVLDLVPLRSTRRIVMDVDHKLRRIGFTNALNPGAILTNLQKHVGGRLVTPPEKQKNVATRLCRADVCSLRL